MHVDTRSAFASVRNTVGWLMAISLTAVAAAGVTYFVTRQRETPLPEVYVNFRQAADTKIAELPTAHLYKIATPDLFGGKQFLAVATADLNLTRQQITALADGRVAGLSGTFSHAAFSSLEDVVGKTSAASASELLENPVLIVTKLFTVPPTGMPTVSIPASGPAANTTMSEAGSPVRTALLRQRRRTIRSLGRAIENLEKTSDSLAGLTPYASDLQTQTVDIKSQYEAVRAMPYGQIWNNRVRAITTRTRLLERTMASLAPGDRNPTAYRVSH